MKRIRILIVDDHAVVRHGISALFAGSREIEVAATASGLMEAIPLADAVDVALVDLRLRHESGIDMIRALKAHRPSLRTIVFTSFGAQQYVQEAIAAGANGFILKHAEPAELAAAIRAVHSGKRHLSPEASAALREWIHYAPLTQRELEVLELLVPGARNRSIARMLGIAEETVKVHVKRILAKLGVKHRAEAVAQAVLRGLVRMD